MRLDTLMQRHDEHKRQGQKIAYSRSDVEQWLMDPVACTYDDYGEAGVPGHLRTRTAWSLTADLKKKDMEVRFYLRDCDDRPIIDNRKAVAWRRWRLAVGKAPHELCHEEIME